MFNNKKGFPAAKLIGLFTGLSILYFALAPATVYGSFKLVNLLSNPLFIFVGIIILVMIFSGGKRR